MSEENQTARPPQDNATHVEKPSQYCRFEDLLRKVVQSLPLRRRR